MAKRVLASSRGSEQRGSGQSIQMKTGSNAASINEAGWTDLRGKDDWKGLINRGAKGSLNEELKKEVTLYGEAAQATYDTVDLRDWSRYRDQNRFDLPDLLNDQHLKDESFFAELPEKGYSAKEGAFLLASEDAQIADSLIKNGQDLVDHVWIGYVAYSEERKDILVAWRGTQKPAEWIADATLDQIPYVPYPKTSNPAADAAPPPKLTVLQKLTPVFVALLWLSPLLLYFAPQRFPAALVSYATTFKTQLNTPSSGYFAKAAVLFWAAIPLVFRRLGYFILAGGAATLLGTAPLVPPAAIIFAIGSLFPAFQAGGLVSLLATAPLAAIAAIPVLELFNIRSKCPGPDLLLAVCASLFVAACHRGSFYRAVLALLVTVFLPLAITAGQAAWAGASVPGPSVHEGFFELYTKAPSEKSTEQDIDAVKEKTPKAPRDTLHETIQKLLVKYPKTETISVSGHSLGAALAVLSAFDLVKSGTNEVLGRRVPVTCYSFEGPRVGNIAFAEEFARLKEEGLTAIRVVNKNDVVTHVPKALFLQNVYYMLGAVFNCYWFCNVIDWFEHVSCVLRLPSAFKHVGVEITLDSTQVDYIQKMKGLNPLDNVKQIHTYHNLECCLHVLSGFSEAPKPFGVAFSRDFGLVNKTGDALKPRFGISPNWLDTLTPNVERAIPGGAIIQPYDEPTTKGEPSDQGLRRRTYQGGDHQRKIGEGPGEHPKKLCKDYIAQYMTKKQ